jgi:homoserine/homoserine lactone efflux protein
MTLELYLVFLSISAVIMFTPGPTVVLAITNGILHGSRDANYSILGNMTALFILSTVSIAGIGALIVANEWMFDLIKWIGGLYLIYLGIGLWRAQKNRVGVREQIEALQSLEGTALFRKGFAVTMSNPKAFVFVTAFLPQFINLKHAVVPQFLVLMFSMMALQFVVLNLYAWMANNVRDWLNRANRLSQLNKFIGLTFIGFGVSIALSELTP